jgi:hypothetical protein
MLKRLGLELWLPLPFVAAGFWLGSTWVNHHVLGQTYEPAPQLTNQSQQSIMLSLSLTVASIDAEIDHDLGATEVTIQTTGSALQELGFEYPLVEYGEIEGAIAQELALSPEIIRGMIRYRVNY